MNTTSPLISAADLESLLHADLPPLLLDLRWHLTPEPEDPQHPVGYEDYLAGHLPGAVFVDLASELASAPGGAEGRHPLPSAEDFAAAVSRWGLQDGQGLVFYDDQGGLSAARGWWLARHAGLDALLLDGGLAAWSALGGHVVPGAVRPPSATVPARPGWGRMPVLDADQAAELARHGVLLDARAGERYRGEVEPIDPRAGHIPGALSAPTADNLDDDARFRPAAELTARFAELGAVQSAAVGVYCGSGVTASHEIAALAASGVEAALFPGSFSAWSADPARRVVVGAAPDARV